MQDLKDLKDLKTPQHIGPQGLALIKHFEGFRAAPYRDPVGIPTIGYGATYYPDTGKRVTLQDAPITEAQASAMLERMVARYALGVARYVQVPLKQAEFDALVSWAYNVGLEAARTSTLMRKLNAGQHAAAAAELLRWDKAGGRPLPGLTRRRQAEHKLFIEGVY